MKKIIYFLCIMFLAGSIKAISPEIIYQENIYSNRIGDKLYSGQLGYIFIDDQIVYCLEPFKIVGKSYNEDSGYLNKYDDDILDYFEMVSYYGYNRFDRNNIYYYMAAQELIWEKILGGDYVYWSTEKDGQGELINIDSYKNEIINDINKFYLKPSFDDKHFSLPFFDEIKIYDSNNVFNTYTEFSYSGNNKIIKNDKGFIVTILEEGYQKIKYSKTLKTDNVTKFYTEFGQQTLASFGINKKINGEFSILGREYYTNLNVVFYDDVTKDVIFDVVFEMESTNELNGMWKNIDGKYRYSNPLNEGKYKINVLEKYEIVSDNEFEVNKKDLQQNTLLEVYLKNIENKDDNIKKDDCEFENNIPNEGNTDDNKNIENDDVDINNDIENDIEEETNEFLENEKGNIEVEKGVQNVFNNAEENNLFDNVINIKSKMIELPNTYNYNLKKYVILFIVFIIGNILYEKEIRY